MMSYYVSPRRRQRQLARWTDAARTEVHIPVDVTADDDGFTLSAYIPGVPSDDLKIEVLEDTVSISGDFPTPEGEDIKYLLRERPTGSFTRTLRLPSALDATKAKAEISDGVLNLHVPKAEYAKAKQIAVKSK